MAVVITARNEADRLAATIAALCEALPGAAVIVADDASEDATSAVATETGAVVVRAPRRLGKGGAATLGARRALETGPEVVLLCDGDLGPSAAALAELVHAVERGEGEVAVAVFSRRVGGGLGLALGVARRVVLARTGRELRAPLSGQRALTGRALQAVLPFAPGFGMETAMAIDTHRAGLTLVELELDLEHRATGRTVAGFRHRGRQLLDILRVYASRR